MKFLITVLFFLIGCSSSKNVDSSSDSDLIIRKKIIVYDTTHKTWCCKIDTTVKKVTVNKYDTSWHHKDSTVCCKFDTTRKHTTINDTSYNHIKITDTTKKTITITRYDTTKKTVCCKYDTTKKTIAITLYDTTIKWTTIPKDSIKWNIISKDSIRWTTKDSIKWNIKTKDTLITNTVAIPIYIPKNTKNINVEYNIKKP